jgi:hypothetical protein
LLSDLAYRQAGLTDLHRLFFDRFYIIQLSDLHRLIFATIFQSPSPLERVGVRSFQLTDFSDLL